MTRIQQSELKQGVYHGLNYSYGYCFLYKADDVIDFSSSIKSAL